MRCERCGGNMTIDRDAGIPVGRSLVNNGIIDRFVIPTIIAACDRCEHVVDLLDNVKNRRETSR